MADPLTIGMIALQAGGQIMGGIEANNNARASAATAEENARLELLQGEQQALAARRDERRATGAMIAGAAGSGGALSGIGDLIGQNAYQRELEILNLRTGATRAANNQYQAAADARNAGRSALVQSMFGAVSSVLTGVEGQRQQRLQRASANSVRGTILRGGTPGYGDGQPNAQPVPRPSVTGGGFNLNGGW